MRKLLVLPALVVGLLTAAPLWAQNTSSIDLSGTWKFFKGDNASWGKPATDDTLWKDIQVPASWQSQGNPTLTGFAWYRKHISVPAAWGSDPLVKQKGLWMDLGTISSAYEIYWNGSLIGQQGSFPPNLKPATTEVHIGVPADKITFGGDNVLAVRVYGEKDPSGILSGVQRLREPTFGDFVTLAIETPDNRAEFKASEGLPFDIVVGNTGPAEWQHGTVVISLLDGVGNQILSSPQTVNVAADKQTRLSMQLKESDLNPGIYTVIAETQMGGTTLQKVARTLVYYPTGIRSSAFRTTEWYSAFKPKLDQFWKTTVAALKNTPIGGTSTLDEAKSTDAVKVYKVSYNALKGQTIYGWLAVPAKATKAPGVVVLPGYGNSTVDPPIMLAQAGFAALAINVHGADVDAKSYTPEGDVYMKGGVDDPNTFAGRGMVAAGLRAVDYLAQRPEVDAAHIGVMGASQGGGLAVDVAALDPRVQVVVANSPVADFPRMLSTSKTNPFVPLVNALDPQAKANLTSTLNYFDPVFLADRVRVPVLITVGMKDTVTPPETAYSLKNAFPQGLVVSINADETNGHGVTPAQAAASYNWLKKFLVG